jgi:hypothetical protein
MVEFLVLLLFFTESTKAIRDRAHCDVPDVGLYLVVAKTTILSIEELSTFTLLCLH